VAGCAAPSLQRHEGKDKTLIRYIKGRIEAKEKQDKITQDKTRQDTRQDKTIPSQGVWCDKV
jgi:hypothetical protein